MKKTVTLFFLITFLISCNEEKGMTKIELNSVQKVLDFYGGKCIRHKGWETINLETTNYFEIEMVENDFFNKDKSKLKYHSANIAYIFYSNLGKEKSKYNQIRVKINLENGESSEFSYSSEKLNEFEKILPLNLKTAELIKNKKFNEVILLFDESIEISENDISKIFKNYDKEYGEFTKSECQGFEYLNTNNFGKVIKTYFVQVREITPTTIWLNFNKDTKKLISIEFY
jgi:hypothetical protein